MQKSAPSVGRILVMVGFALSCFGLLLFLWLAFGGPVPLKPKGYRFTVSFKEAGQLAQEADVRISGVPVGKVKTIVNDKRTGSTDATIELKPQYAPMPRDARATLRQKTLLGETYVELTPGHKAPGNEIPDGGRLAAGRVAPTVELDEIFRAFDPKTRLAFQDWMQTQAVAITGRGRDLNDAFGTLRPFVDDTSVLVKILNAQEPTVRGVVRNTGTVFAALSARQGQLRGLVSNSNRVFATTAARNQDLQEIFRALPTFEQESATTINRLTEFSKQTNPLVTQLRPAAVQLSPTLQQLSALSPDLKALFVQPQPGDHRLEGRPPGDRAVPQGAPAAPGRARPAAAPARAAGRGPRAVHERAERDLRELRRGHAGGGRRQALPAHDEPAEPRGRRGLPEAPADEPPQPLRVPADVRHPGQGRGQAVRDAPVHDAEPVPDGQPPHLGLPDP